MGVLGRYDDEKDALIGLASKQSTWRYDESESADSNSGGSGDESESDDESESESGSSELLNLILSRAPPVFFFEPVGVLPCEVN